MKFWMGARNSAEPELDEDLEVSQTGFNHQMSCCQQSNSSVAGDLFESRKRWKNYYKPCWKLAELPLSAPSEFF
tara:strand:- start:1764 stop:1985 length:222 start_codon:yes stop_codon:yes gene_type:complete